MQTTGVKRFWILHEQREEPSARGGFRNRQFSVPVHSLKDYDNDKLIR